MLEVMPQLHAIIRFGGYPTRDLNMPLTNLAGSIELKLANYVCFQLVATFKAG